jgi:hypothetical protein
MPRWYEDPVYLAGVVGLAGLGWYVNRQDKDGGVVDVFERGGQVSYGTYDDKLGIVLEAPEVLRQGVSDRMGFYVPIDQASAARMLRSEGAKQGELRVHVALNDLAHFPYADTLHELLTYSNDPKRRGWYGAQYSPAVLPDYPKANARRYSTAKNFYSGDVFTAGKAIQDHSNGIDPAQGATKFVDVDSLSSQAGTRSFEDIKALWAQEGLKPFTLPQYGENLVLFRKEA